MSLNPAMLDMALLQRTMESAVSALSEGHEQVHLINQSTVREVTRLEAELAELHVSCTDAIDRVEVLEKESRRTRERLLVVNRDIRRYSETDMREAYQRAENVQIELAQWREREYQFRVRRDDVARRLKDLRVTVQVAEALKAKFNNAIGYLNAQFGQVSNAVQHAHMQNLLGFHMVDMLENERSWIASKLHDGPMQTLASVGLLLQAGAMQSPTTMKAAAPITQVIDELRDMVFHLKPPLLADLGLLPALRSYLQEWSQRTSVSSDVHLVGCELELTHAEKVTLFRAVEEALDNVQKHASAQKVELTIKYTLDAVHIQVTDDGCGLDAADWLSWVQSGRSGLSIVKQRVEMLGGTVMVEKADPSGTIVRLELPVVREGAL